MIVRAMTNFRLAGLRRGRVVVGGEERVHVVAVDGLHLEADRLHALRGVFALRLLRHRVERDVVRVVDEDQVVELPVARELERLHRDAFLHAAVAREDDDVMVEDFVLCRIEAGGGHLLCDGLPTPFATPWPSGPLVVSTPSGSCISSG